MRLFIDKFKNRSFILLMISLGLGLLVTLFVSPGIFYSDSYGRWSMAIALTKGNMGLLDDWLSFPPQLFMADASCVYVLLQKLKANQSFTKKKMF